MALASRRFVSGARSSQLFRTKRGCKPLANMPDATGVLAVIRAARPAFRSNADKVAYAVHATLSAHGLQLVALGDQADAGFTKEVLVSIELDSLDGWNAEAGQYTFLYTHQIAPPAAASAPLQVRTLVKCLNLDALLLINILSSTAPANVASACQPTAAASDSPQTLEVSIEEYTTDATDVASSYKKLSELVGKVASLLDASMAQVTKAVATKEPRNSTQASTKSSLVDHSQPSRQPGRQPEGDDPYRPDWQPAPRGGGSVPFPHNPLMVGGEDVVPAGIRPPGHGGGFNPFAPSGPGGMQVGPGHPFFEDRLRHPELQPGRGSLPNGPGGARWDPIAPPGIPGYNPEDFQQPRGGRRDIDPDIGLPGPGRGTDWDSMYG